MVHNNIAIVRIIYCSGERIRKSFFDINNYAYYMALDYINAIKDKSNVRLIYIDGKLIYDIYE